MGFFLPLIQLANSDEMRAQQGLVDKVNAMGSNELSQGRLIENVDLSVGDNTIEHKLGRAFKGYIIVNLSAASTIFNSGGVDASLMLKLNSSAAAQVSLWVF